MGKMEKNIVGLTVMFVLLLCVSRFGFVQKPFSFVAGTFMICVFVDVLANILYSVMKKRQEKTAIADFISEVIDSFFTNPKKSEDYVKRSKYSATVGTCLLVIILSKNLIADSLTPEVREVLRSSGNTFATVVFGVIFPACFFLFAGWSIIEKHFFLKYKGKKEEK